MSNRANHNCGADAHPKQSRRKPLSNSKVLPRDSSHCARNEESNTVRHIYVHIPFCARICPYCAFYKDLLDRSQTSRFCEALLRELELYQGAAVSSPPAQFGDLLYILRRRFTSAAARPRRLILRNWNYCCADFTKDSNYRNWLNGRLKQIREASPRERQRF